MYYCDECVQPVAINDRNFTAGGGVLCDSCLEKKEKEHQQALETGDHQVASLYLENIDITLVREQRHLLEPMLVKAGVQPNDNLYGVIELLDVILDKADDNG